MTENFIEMVKSHRILYDLSHPDCKNTRLRDKVWAEIGNALGEEGEQMKKKWKNLRDSFGKHIRSQQIIIGPKSKILNRYRTWPWAEQMAVFKPFLQNAETEPLCDYQVEWPVKIEVNPLEWENKTEEQEESQQSTSTDMQPSSPPIEYFTRPAASTARKRQRPHETPTQSYPSYLQHQDKLAEYDDIDLICLGYARTIKKFSATRQTMVKFEIAKILMKEELAQQDEDGVGTPAHHVFSDVSPDCSQKTLT